MDACGDRIAAKGSKLTKVERNTPKVISSYLAMIGRTGGIVRSQAKTEAGRRNIIKANAAKAKKKVVDKPLGT